MSEETLEPPLPPIDAEPKPSPNACSASNLHSARTIRNTSTRNGRPHPNGSATDTCAKPSKCSPPPTKRNPRAPTDPIMRNGCASNTVN